MRKRQVTFPESRDGVVIDGLEVVQHQVVMVGTPRLGYVSVRAFYRDGAGDAKVRTVAFLRGHEQLVRMAKAILARDAADRRRRKR